MSHIEILGIVDQDFEFFNDVFNLIVHRPKRYKIQPNYLEILEDTEFLARFRITKNTFWLLLDEIKDQIEPVSRR